MTPAQNKRKGSNPAAINESLRFDAKTIRSRFLCRFFTKPRTLFQMPVFSNKGQAKAGKAKGFGKAKGTDVGEPGVFKGKTKGEVQDNYWKGFSISVMSDSTTAANKNYRTMACRNKQVYFAKLAEQAKLYDAMADHMESVVKLGDELSVEERNLLSVAFKNAVKNRLAACLIIHSAEQRETSKGNDDNAAWACEYCDKVEGELQKICGVILGLLDQSLIPKASNDESKVFYQKMKADYCRYVEEMDRVVYFRCQEESRYGLVLKVDGMDQTKYNWPAQKLVSQT